MLVTRVVVKKATSRTRARTQKYFSSFQQIDQRSKAGDYEDAYKIALQVLEYLPDVAEDIGETFRSPPLQYVCTHLVLNRNEEALQGVREQLAKHVSLKRFVGEVDAAIQELKMVEIIFEHIKANPGVLQRSLGKALGVDGRRASTLLKLADQRGIVRRKATKGTYALQI